MFQQNLQNKTILVTGASSGIGRECAIVLSGMGAELVISGKNEERLQQTLQSLSLGNHRLLAANLTQPDAVAELVNKLPPLNGLLHCAGIWKPQPIKFLQPQTARLIMEVNYMAAVMLVSQLLQQKKMLSGASVVFVSSIAAHQPYKGGAAYAASKAALEAFAKTLALETAHAGMRSNCIAPAMVQSPILIQAQTTVTEAAMQHHLNQYPLRPGVPNDVAQAAAFLLSDASSWITGATLHLNGGIALL
ncbi:MAG TPA: SDR family oxidoreductase [Chitinophagales bacterium]|nr:SDR family oxidoreductase [Chitinophagales bacterium]HRK27953.1 SDR family oxidoreductase [Chitinophagales bacterium]